ncbi:unnamed protein product [Clavelina lepadiformis]|uniref:Uncharacterized protein n=1 Tax=Clavelina lepadiformis TaxID=159417 RepID=A0ABP0GVD3_CLALP
MKKKIRRLLGRGRQPSSDGAENKNKRLPALLAERSTAAPNYYYKTDEKTKEVEDDLKNEKNLEKVGDVIELPEPELAEEKVTEITLEPINHGRDEEDQTMNDNDSNLHKEAEAGVVKIDRITDMEQYREPAVRMMNESLRNGRLATAEDACTDQLLRNNSCPGARLNEPGDQLMQDHSQVRYQQWGDLCEEENAVLDKPSSKIFSSKRKKQDSLPIDVTLQAPACENPRSICGTVLQQDLIASVEYGSTRGKRFLQGQNNSVEMEHCLPLKQLPSQTGIIESEQVKEFGQRDQHFQNGNWEGCAARSGGAQQQTDAPCTCGRQPALSSFSQPRYQNCGQERFHEHTQIPRRLDAAASLHCTALGRCATHRRTCGCWTYLTACQCCHHATQGGAAAPRPTLCHFCAPGASIHVTKCSGTSVGRRISVLFTIIDEDASERLPRILEFAKGSAQDADSSQLLHHHDHNTSTACQHHDISTECESVAVRACKRHLEDHQIDDFRASQQPVKFSCKSLDQSHRPRLVDMAPSVGFFTNQETARPRAPNRTNATCSMAARSEQSFRKTEEAVLDRLLCNPNGYPCSDIYAIAQEEAEGNGQQLSPLGHFELSQKSYAKLIAFCHNKKVISSKSVVVSSSNQELSWHYRTSGNISSGNRHADPGQFHSNLVGFENDATELCTLARVFETVEECPWYWGEMSGAEAKKQLSGTSQGTFLLRDSSDPRYLFSLSLLTKRGPTSIRIVYSNGLFRFDSEREDESHRRRRPLSASFPRPKGERRQCVIHMILHYTKYLMRKSKCKQEEDVSSDVNCPHTDTSSRTNSYESRSESDRSQPNGGQSKRNGAKDDGLFMCYWMERGGRKEIPVLLTHPQPKKVHNLQHLSRLAISKHLRLWSNHELVQDLPLPELLQNYVRKYPYPI